MKIAVFLPNWIGDVVMATPALRALRAHFADDEIVYVGRSGPLVILAGSTWANQTIIDTSGQKGQNGKKTSNLAGFTRLALHLRRRHFDLGVLLPNSFRTALLGYLGGIDRLAGYARDGRSCLLDVKLQPRQDSMGFVPIPAIDYYNALAGALGVEANSRQMELPVVEADEQAADQLLSETDIDRSRPIVMLNPGAAFGTSKLWLSDRYAELADELIQRRGVQIIINAAPSEKAIANAVAAAMKNKPAINFAQRHNSLGLLKSLLRRCSLLVTNDTGARHIAAAVGAAVVTIFGSTDPDWTTLYYGRERIIRTNAPCAPCQQKLCPQPAGPFYHQCMAGISVQSVLAATEELLDSPGGKPAGGQS
jgi:heptosyltransferase-2